MNEKLAGRLEGTGARARMLLGGGLNAEGLNAESTQSSFGPLDEKDAARLAKRIQDNGLIDADAAQAVASEIVAEAQKALTTLGSSIGNAGLTDSEVLALESVIHVRSRPALRVLENRLESLAHHPSSEMWQDFITDYEDGIMRVTAATGQVVVKVFGSGNSTWVQGSAWLVAPNRVVTNRHVLFTDDLRLVESNPVGNGFQTAANVAIAIEFTADNRANAKSIFRKVTDVVYMAPGRDPVDVAVLAIEPIDDFAPLQFMDAKKEPPRTLFVVGHPAPMTSVPAAVQAVFGNPDGRKRVSFGKLLEPAPSVGTILYDASTVGGYSGAPVVGISSTSVTGLHYYGDPVNGNLAVSAEAIRNHPVYQYCQTS